MKKSILALFLVFALAFSLAACGGNVGNNQTADKETPAKDFEWEIISGGLKITKYNGNAKNVVIPSIIENQKVISLGDAFTGNVVVESLVLSEYHTEVTSKNCNLKECDNLKTLKCPRTTKFDGTSAPALETLELSKVEDYELSYFEAFITSIKKINLPAAKVIKNEYGRTLVYTKLEEVTLAVEPKYYVYRRGGNETHTADGYNFELEEGRKDYIAMLCPENDINKYHFEGRNMENYTYHEITDSNRAQIYCDFFGVDSITVNGTKYTK